MWNVVAVGSAGGVIVAIEGQEATVVVRWKTSPGPNRRRPKLSRGPHPLPVTKRLNRAARGSRLRPLLWHRPMSCRLR